MDHIDWMNTYKQLKIKLNGNEKSVYTPIRFFTQLKEDEKKKPITPLHRKVVEAVFESPVSRNPFDQYQIDIAMDDGEVLIQETPRVKKP